MFLRVNPYIFLWGLHVYTLRIIYAFLRVKLVITQYQRKLMLIFRTPELQKSPKTDLLRTVSHDFLPNLCVARKISLKGIFIYIEKMTVVGCVNEKIVRESRVNKGLTSSINS